MYILNGKETTYQKFYDQSREFSPDQVIEAANDALDNWDWDRGVDNRIAEGDEGICKEFLSNWDKNYVINSFADNDGVIRLDRAYKNVWDWLDEFMISSYRTYQADKAHWGW